jgi:hypothetical protein
MSKTSKPRSWRFVAVAFLALAISSCGRKNLYPVHGKLFVDDRPAAGAIIQFNPVAATAAAGASPYGHVDATGGFTLSTFATNDGASPGEYVVTIQWHRRRSNPFEADGPDKLQGRYSQASTSTLKVRIEPKPNELEPFRLSTGSK